MKLINIIGYSNLITIITFAIGAFLSYCFYFRTFYRLVYSTSTIYPRTENFCNWQDENAIFQTRVLFYNNGRKSLSKNEVKRLDVFSSDEILDYKILKGKEALSVNQKKNNIKMKINRLDKSKFVLLEISHKGRLLVDGEISESGELLKTETKAWLIVNILVFIILNILFFLFIINTLNSKETSNMIFDFISLLLIFGFYFIIRCIHSLFFIPDSITDKYIEPTDKFSRAFKNI